MLLLTNGVIATMDPARPLAEAAVVEGGYFAYVGTAASAAAFAARYGGETYETLDLQGRFLMPGFNDSHLHFIHYVKTKLSVDLFGTTSLSQLRQRMELGLQDMDTCSGRWLLGEGWNQELFTDEQRFPTCRDLDQVSTQVPSLILRPEFQSHGAAGDQPGYRGAVRHICRAGPGRRSQRRNQGKRAGRHQGLSALCGVGGAA